MRVKMRVKQLSCDGGGNTLYVFSIYLSLTLSRSRSLHSGGVFFPISSIILQYPESTGQKRSLPQISPLAAESANLSFFPFVHSRIGNWGMANEKENKK